MKRIFLAILTICSFAAQSQNDETGVIVASEFHITRPLTEIFRDNPVDENRNFGGIESSDRQHRIPANFPFTVADGPAYGNDERTLQTKWGTEMPLKQGLVGLVRPPVASGLMILRGL